MEAGLRSFDKYSPYPEEMNRRLRGHSRYTFCPTASNKENLLKENVSEDNIYVTGNTVIDALSDTVFRIIPSRILLKDFSFSGKRTVLVTAHRRRI